MSTLKQKKLAQEIVNNLSKEEPLNKQQLVVSSGYSEASAKSSAHLILEQKGVQDELKALGFDEETAKTVVGNILLNEEERANDRLKAAEMVFKVHGSYAPEKQINLNVAVDADEEVREAARLLNEIHRGTS